MIDRAAAAFIAPMSALERLRVVLDSGGGGGGGGGRGGYVSSFLNPADCLPIQD